MVPIRDENESYKVPYVTYALIAINLAVFLFELSLSETALESFFREYAVVPAGIWPALGEVLDGNTAAIPALKSLITAMFLHGGFLHIIGNMLYLWVFGDNIEERMGHIGYLIFYLAGGIVASLLQSALDPTSTIPSLGASGAIAAVLGAYIVKFPNVKVRAIFPLGFIPIPLRLSAFWFLGLWFVQQAFSSFASLSADTALGMEKGGVAYLAHAGGFVFGLVVALFLRDPDPYRRVR